MEVAIERDQAVDIAGSILTANEVARRHSRIYARLIQLVSRPAVAQRDGDGLAEQIVIALVALFQVLRKIKDCVLLVLGVKALARNVAAQTGKTEYRDG